MNSLLPPNKTLLEDALSNAILAPIIPNGLDKIWSPDLCPPSILPWLAWGLSVDAWSPDWPIAIKRAQIKKSPEIHRRKGTVQAVKDVVNAFGGQLALREWWQMTPRGEPGTFTIFLSLAQSSSPTAQFLSAVIEAIKAVKPESAHFTFNLALAGFAKIGVAAIGKSINFTRINAILNPIGASNIVYLTDAEGHFLTDSEGNLLIEN